MRGPENLAVNARSRSFSKYPGLSERMCKLLLAIHASTAAKVFERVEGGRKILVWETMPMNSWMHGHGIAMAWIGGINQFLCRCVQFAVLAVRINQQVGINRDHAPRPR